MRDDTLLIETSNKRQIENCSKINKFFSLPVTVSEHKTLHSSKGIIKDRTLKEESEDIKDYLKDQGVINVKRFKVKNDKGTLINNNTLLLTFNSTTVPKSLKIFYRIISVELYVLNPLKCFNCQMFGHHETRCTVPDGSVGEKCGADDFDYHANSCKNPEKCVDCGGNHVSRANKFEIWIKEKEIMKIKVTDKITYFEAKKRFKQKPEFCFSKVVQSLTAKLESKTISTQYNIEDSNITSS